MKHLLVATLALAALSALPAAAQTVTRWPAPPATAPATRTYHFPAGTPLALRTRTQLTTKQNKPGDRFYLEVAESLTFRGQVVIPAGATAIGEIATVQRNGHFGRKGKLDIRLLQIETDSGPVRLSGRANDEGTSGTITSVATILFVSPLGFLVHGTSAQLPPDTPVRGYLAEDMQFALQPQAQIASTQVRPDAFTATIATAGGGGTTAQSTQR